ncbi:hypothetical protein [Sphingomonas sp.]|uniref:hypothetical protein n=1 Tax=Sphingomonas sp. TaxID=28214 RepID=UPI0035BBBADC
MIARTAAALALLVAAPAAADPLQDRVLAGMKATDTGDVAFAQTTRIERTGAAATEIVTRYDPRATAHWTVTRVDGRAPTAKQTADIVKAATRSPIPGYARMARWFGGRATRVAEAPGSVTYRFAALPKGVVMMGSHDASADTVADAVVNTAGPAPYVERVRFTSSKPFRMMLVARVDRYVVTASYAPLADGRLFPSVTDSDIAGSLMGKAGSIRTRSRYSEAHAGR